MLAGFFQGIVHNRALMREAQVTLAIRCFTGYYLDENPPDHSSLTRIPQCWVKRYSSVRFALMQRRVRLTRAVHVDVTSIKGYDLEHT